MAIKRLRIYAGPNGSGKSVLHRQLSNIVNNGFFVNADLMYKELSEKSFYDFADIQLEVNELNWLAFVTKHGLSEQSSAVLNSKIVNNILSSQSSFNSYDVAILADFVRNELIQQGVSFSCETVFSHPGKLDLIKKATQNGYRTYLYFCCAGNADICVDRVKQRVKEGGHDVPVEKIKQRFNKTLANLLPAIREVDRAYIFDNSGTDFELVLEKSGDDLISKVDSVPKWVNESVLEKLIIN